MDTVEMVARFAGLVGALAGFVVMAVAAMQCGF